jgi:tetratricopeptide (TPR) repeat protein
MKTAFITGLCVVVSATASAVDLQSALERSRQLAAEHRYQDVLDLLGGVPEQDDPEARYAVAAETGRAYFHLGNYQTAHACFREAVSLRPKRTETALYLMATSYLVGQPSQSYAILRELLRSGARDLYLAVTLPGERTFLADPEVWRILDEFSVPLELDPVQGSILGVRLGQPRAAVESTFGTTVGASGTTVTARAGPWLIWAFGFDDENRLSQIMLHNEHLYRYTPYRLRFGSGLDWRSTPEQATSSLGAPSLVSRESDDAVLMVWQRGPNRLTLEFAVPQPPAPPMVDGTRPLLRVVRLEPDRTGPTDELP